MSVAPPQYPCRVSCQSYEAKSVHYRRIEIRGRRLLISLLSFFCSLQCTQEMHTNKHPHLIITLICRVLMESSNTQETDANNLQREILTFYDGMDHNHSRARESLWTVTSCLFLWGSYVSHSDLIQRRLPSVWYPCRCEFYVSALHPWKETNKQSGRRFDVLCHCPQKTKDVFVSF